jgi:pimeloyl-ACP methyl ester carboxylesterase
VVTACLVAEFLEALGLRGVTVVGNDTGGAVVQLLAVENQARSRGSFDNFPPGLTGKALVTAGKLPPALFGASMQQRRAQARPAGTVRVRLVEIPDSYTLVPLDQPTTFARALSVFLRATVRPGGRRPLAASVA